MTVEPERSSRTEGPPKDDVYNLYFYFLKMDVDEYEREHLYPILEQTIIPEFRERRTESSRSDYNHTKKKELKVQPSAPQFNQVNKIDDGLQPSNSIQLFLLEKKKLDEKLIHYKKIKNRWTNADSSIKIVCISITGILTISTSVMSGLTLIALVPTTGIIITSIFGGFNAVYLFLSESISIGLTSKKKKIYREVCEQLELGINKLYLFQHKAIEDGILTNDEIIECQKIIEEINNKISKIKYGNDGRSPREAEINNDVKKQDKVQKIEKKKLIKEEFLQNNVLAKLEYEAKLRKL